LIALKRNSFGDVYYWQLGWKRMLHPLPEMMRHVFLLVSGKLFKPTFIRENLKAPSKGSVTEDVNMEVD